MLKLFSRDKSEKASKTMSSDDYEILNKRIIDVQSTISELKNEVLSVTLEMDAFRNKVMRAYQRRTETEEPKSAKIGSPIRR